MTVEHDTALIIRLGALNALRARQVARLVLECQTSLRDALAAIEDADRRTGDNGLAGDTGVTNEQEAPLKRRTANACNISRERGRPISGSV